MLLIYLLLSSGSVECTSCNSLRLFRNYVYYHFIFPTINKMGGWNKTGGLEKFSKINKQRGEDYSVLENRWQKVRGHFTYM